MSFIGNRPDSFGYSSTSYDHFSGTGSQTVYTLTRSVSANADIFVTVNNVPQDPGVAYYVTNLNTLTFTSAPSSVANNIVIVYRNFVQTGLALGANTVTSFTIAPGAVQAYQISSVSNTSITGLITAAQLAPGAGGNPTANNLSNTAGNTIITSANSITMNAVSGIIDASNTTGALIVPTGTTAQRPVNAANGAIRWNTSNTGVEFYNSSAWVNPLTNLTPGVAIQTQYVISNTRVNVNPGATTLTEASNAYRVNITPLYSNSLILLHYFIPATYGVTTPFAANYIIRMSAVRYANGTGYNGSYTNLTSAGTTSGNYMGLAGYNYRISNGYDYNDGAAAIWNAIDLPGSTNTVQYGFVFTVEGQSIQFGQSLTSSSTYSFYAPIVIIAQEIKQ